MVAAAQMPEPAKAEPPAIVVPGFTITWPKIITLAGAILVSIGGGFWGLSKVIYEDLKDKVTHIEETTNRLDRSSSAQSATLISVDRTTQQLSDVVKQQSIQIGSLAEIIAKQGAQIGSLAQNQSGLNEQLKTISTALADTREKVIAINARMTQFPIPPAPHISGPQPEQ